MKIILRRFFSDSDRTLGMIHLDGMFSCFVVEDEKRKVKVKGETRIPEGEYKIKLRDEGGMNEKYKLQFGERHKGMLQIMDVPGFEYIYLHYGNYESQTDGCPLTGLSVMMVDGKYAVGHSIPAYLKLYSLVTAHLVINEPVSIKIIDIEGEK